jgi:hypothetical protein
LLRSFTKYVQASNEVEVLQSNIKVGEEGDQIKNTDPDFSIVSDLCKNSVTEFGEHPGGLLVSKFLEGVFE